MLINNDFLVQNCSKLDYNEENGLVLNDGFNEFEKNIMVFAREKLEADATFFYRAETGFEVPLIYFKKMQIKDEKKIAELHKLLWNRGDVPLYFIVLPYEILVYSSYRYPEEKNGGLNPEAGLLDEINLLHDVESKISMYKRSELVSGAFWEKNNARFDKNNHVSEKLLENLLYIKEVLELEGLEKDVIHSLLIRSIFIKYLEDRKDNNGLNVFPNGFFDSYLPGANCFIDLLVDKKVTYKFFNDIRDKFNGDSFDINKKELNEIQQKHLNLLKLLLHGDYLKEKQIVLWPLYSFDVIPIELLSEIYQAFYHEEKYKKGREGTYYTPKYLVDFIMDEIYPWEGNDYNKKILDPACGSGVFLVEAYRRMVNKWINENKRRPNIKDLMKLLKSNIFGVDKNYNAIQVSAFSLYLSICDFLTPRDIWLNVIFEPLVHTNLIPLDFFDKKMDQTIKFDIILGNPPWESQLSLEAKDYMKINKLKIGDKQICQLFLWRVSNDFSKPETKICMIVGSKLFLFNRSNTNKKFRHAFFLNNTVEKIFNLSELRYLLFREANTPASIVLFSPNSSSEKKPILYSIIRPSYTPQDQFLFIINSHDVHKIPYTLAVQNDLIWKILMFGTPRDFDLINRLSNIDSLSNFLSQNKLSHSEGFIEGKKDKKPAPHLFNQPYLKAGSLELFAIDETKLQLCKIEEATRPRTKEKVIFKGPHLVISQHPKQGQGLISAVLLKDAVFTDTFLGIGGSENTDIYNYISTIINSDLILYYEFMTSRQWKVDRGHLQKEELINLPFPSKPIINLSTEKIENFKNTDVDWKSFQDDIYAWYDLTWAEKILINDQIDLIYNYHWEDNKFIIDKPIDNNELLIEYANVFRKVLSESFSNSSNLFSTLIYWDKNSSIIIIRFNLETNKDQVSFISGESLNIEIKQLDDILLKEKNTSIYIQRTLRKYDDNSIYIIKPNKYKYWLKSQALYDADICYSDIMGFKGRI